MSHEMPELVEPIPPDVKEGDEITVRWKSGETVRVVVDHAEKVGDSIRLDVTAIPTKPIPRLFRS